MANGGQSQSTGAEGQQVGSAGGDVKQMTVGQLIDIANQQNFDIEALNNLVGDVQAQIEAGNIQAGGEQGGGSQQGGQGQTG